MTKTQKTSEINCKLTPLVEYGDEFLQFYEDVLSKEFETISIPLDFYNDDSIYYWNEIIGDFGDWYKLSPNKVVVYDNTIEIMQDIDKTKLELIKKQASIIKKRIDDLDETITSEEIFNIYNEYGSLIENTTLEINCRWLNFKLFDDLIWFLNRKGKLKSLIFSEDADLANISINQFRHFQLFVPNILVSPLNMNLVYYGNSLVHLRTNQILYRTIPSGVITIEPCIDNEYLPMLYDGENYTYDFSKNSNYKVASATHEINDTSLVIYKRTAKIILVDSNSDYIYLSGAEHIEKEALIKATNIKTLYVTREEQIDPTIKHIQIPSIEVIEAVKKIEKELKNHLEIVFATGVKAKTLKALADAHRSEWFTNPSNIKVTFKKNVEHYVWFLA